MVRNEFLDILTVLNHLAHADGAMHPSEKKVLIALFRAAKVTSEEQEQIRRHTSLEEMMEEINSDEAKKALIDLLALIAGADGVFQEEEEELIKKVMKRLGIIPGEHPYFKDGEGLDIALVRSNAKKILESIASQF